MESWQVKAARLAATLADAGKIRSPSWRAAVERTPRHVFVPAYYQLDPDSGRWTWHEVVDEEAFDLVYSNTALFVMAEGLSSSSMPGLMTRMLEDLVIADGDRVLEIGTGTGYNAALLCHRLGDAQVCSVDIEAELVELAGQRLATLGYRPLLRIGDGAGGLPGQAPFDRVIATCSVPRVPWSWVEQTRVDGRLLVDLKIGKQAGNLVHLVRTPDGAEGRFDRSYGSFMGMRTPGDPRSRIAGSAGPWRRRTSTLDLLRPWENTVVWFLAALTMPQVSGFGLRAEPGSTVLDSVIVAAHDGSRCEVTAPVRGVRQVHEKGRPLWSHIEDAHTFWVALGRPGWERFGLTVHADQQVVWLDSPTATHRWPLVTDEVGVIAE